MKSTAARHLKRRICLNFHHSDTRDHGVEQAIVVNFIWFMIFFHLIQQFRKAKRDNPVAVETAEL